MACITIRNLADNIKKNLKIRAALHSRSMEEEVREILRMATLESTPPRNLAEAIRARISLKNRTNLELPDREAIPEQTHFSKKS